MITTADEYLGALFKINENANIPNLAVVLPRSEAIYNIDLDSRIIEAPEFISVVDDHVSETIYFLVDRYFDGVDLSTTGCIIQYINAKGEARLYQVPFFDITTYHSMNKILIPWCIEGEATKAAGDVIYSIRFFKVDLSKQYITFNLNTLPATSKVKEGLKVVDTYTLAEITEEDFKKGEVTYFTKNSKGEYKVAEKYDSKEEYYIFIDQDLNYPASYLDTLLDRISNLERETQCYWYDATVRNKMDTTTTG